jgi:hypothetical protein
MNSLSPSGLINVKQFFKHRFHQMAMLDFVDPHPQAQ